jgi:glucokinase
MLLTVDVGATKTAVAVLRDPADARAPVASAVYPSSDWDDVVPLVRGFLDENDVAVDRAAFGVPGPVVAGHARLTNLPWAIGTRRLREELGLASVAVVNDLQGMAQAIPELREDEVETVRPADAVEHGVIGVVAPGTGLGEAFLTWDGERYRAHPSEGGHTDFAPANALQRDLLRYVRQDLSHVSYERVCSGSAIPRLYAFLRDTGRARESPELARRLQESEDETATIFEEAEREEGPDLCRQTVDLFVEILGAEIGNLALSVFATGGMCLAGGIPPRILPRLREDRFVDAVLHKGRLTDSELMERLVVRVATINSPARIGLARIAADFGESATGGG